MAAARDWSSPPNTPTPHTGRARALAEGSRQQVQRRQTQAPIWTPSFTRVTRTRVPSQPQCPCWSGEDTVSSDLTSCREE